MASSPSKIFPKSNEAVYLVKDDRRLDGALVLQRRQTLLPLLQLEGLVHDTLNLDFAGVQVVDGSGELVGLGEATQNGDLVTD